MGLLSRYFDDALPRILLYRQVLLCHCHTHCRHSLTQLSFTLLYCQERSQYDSVKKSHSKLSPSMIYGGEHLLRLFVRYVCNCFIMYYHIVTFCLYTFIYLTMKFTHVYFCLPYADCLECYH